MTVIPAINYYAGGIGKNRRGVLNKSFTQVAYTSLHTRALNIVFEVVDLQVKTPETSSEFRVSQSVV